MGSSLARRYAEVVEVQRRDDVPAQFLWRGRLYVVRAVLGHWLEAGVWWRAPEATALLVGDTVASAAEARTGIAVDDAEREFWRVEAGAGRAAGAGVYDLCFDWAAGAWSVAAVLD